MTDKILFIKAISEKVYDIYCEGFRIKTEKHELKLLISAFQECCERWGYATANENTEDYIGAEYLGYDTIYSDDVWKNADKDTVENLNDDEARLLFLNVKTSKGTLDFTVYNAHNGFYGHSAYLIIDDKFIERTCL